MKQTSTLQEQIMAQGDAELKTSVAAAFDSLKTLETKYAEGAFLGKAHTDLLTSGGRRLNFYEALRSLQFTAFNRLQQSARAKALQSFLEGMEAVFPRSNN